jgi:predicted extracellular nuclease
MPSIHQVIVTLYVFIIIGLISCHNGHNVTSTDKDNSGIVIGFYNVENLFDTSNDPKINDEDFTPEGKLQWDNAKYQTKLQHIAEVMDSLPGDLPVAMGLCEIENRSVLEDLIRQPKIARGQYDIVHKDSPDERGIDVALLYRKDLAQVQSSEFITVKLPNPEDPNTRDILYCVLRLKGEDLHVFVNHWPSRGGGQLETEGNRIELAKALHTKVSSIVEKQPDAKILLMGDFNDYPTDKSIQNVLNAGQSKPSMLYNYMYGAVAKNEGTHYYKGEWGVLDQFIGSWSLVESSKGLHAAAGSQQRFYDDLVLFKDKDGQARPNRTYVGDSYKAGYSDHLAIYIRLSH